MENGAIGFIDSAPYVTLLFYIIKALHRGLIIDKNHNLIPLHINTDLIKLVHTIEYDYILFTNPLLECMQLIQELDTVKVAHIFRVNNKVAKKLVKKGIKILSIDFHKLFQFHYCVRPPVQKQTVEKLLLLEKVNYLIFAYKAGMWPNYKSVLTDLKGVNDSLNT